MKLKKSLPIAPEGKAFLSENDSAIFLCIALFRFFVMCLELTFLSILPVFKAGFFSFAALDSGMVKAYDFFVPLNRFELKSTHHPL